LARSQHSPQVCCCQFAPERITGGGREKQMRRSRGARDLEDVDESWPGFQVPSLCSGYVQFFPRSGGPWVAVGANLRKWAPIKTIGPGGAGLRAESTPSGLRRFDRTRSVGLHLRLLTVRPPSGPSRWPSTFRVAYTVARHYRVEGAIAQGSCAKSRGSTLNANPSRLGNWRIHRTEVQNRTTSRKGVSTTGTPCTQFMYIFGSRAETVRAHGHAPLLLDRS